MKLPHMLDTEIYNRLLAAVERLPRGEKLGHAAAAKVVSLDPEALRARLLVMARLDARVPPLLDRIALNTLTTVED